MATQARKVPLTVRVLPEQRAFLERLAPEWGVSVSEVVRMMLRQFQREEEALGSEQFIPGYL